ncbi:MAG: class I SAM-dependent rRNA methyltransferase [Alphaproteobacteria bacterium]|nr:MAG: class I SAM-dependent rRNA methyltransferase [Alphaproteobacteria bacterium]
MTPPSDVSGDQADLPVVRLKPKADARAIRHGSPWVFSDELVLDRRTRALAPGTIATLEGADRVPIATVAVNPLSRIVARVLSRTPGRRIDRAWFADRIRVAQDLRKTLYDKDFYRLVHAEGDRLPGVVIDRFGDAAVVQPNAAWADRALDDLVAALVEVTGVSTVVKNGAGRARRLEGLPGVVEVLAGGVSGPVEVPMNGAIYLADLVGGQKTGLYFDQRDNHAFAAGLARGGRVLDVFAHVGGFSLAALAAGAASALAVDSSADALRLAEGGAAATGVADRFETLRADAFEALEAMGAEGRRFDLVVCDPPAFAPARQALDAGLRAYERVARLSARLVEPGGFLVLCSCSHAADLASFRQVSVRGIGRAGRRAQIIRTGFQAPDHPLHPRLAETGYLKALTFRLV